MRRNLLFLFLMFMPFVAMASAYTSYLTIGRGFIEVTNTSGLIADEKYYYILASAENTGLIVGVGQYEGKPGWASEETKTLRYRSADTDPILDLSNFFTIEKSGSYIGFRNVVYSSDLFQTHDNAGYMYVNTFTDKTLDEWSYLTPTYQNGYWLFESGKYPMSSENWACGYLGPWNNQVKEGEPIALNRKNVSGDEAGHYRLFRITKSNLMAFHLYSAILSPSNGFTEVTSTADMTDGSDDCYLLTAAETKGLYVGVGRYEAKPGWASEDTKALRYRPASANPLLDLSNFFTIEKSGSYIGFRNLYYSSDLFQTHDNAGYMYVNTFTDKTLDEWSYLTPTYQNGYWLFESGKYPLSSDDWACGYLGPWNKLVKEGEPIALNRRNTSDDKAGHYRLFRISKKELVEKRNRLMLSVSPIAPVSMTWRVVNPSFETGDETGWSLLGKEDGNEEFKTRDYQMSGRDGSYLMNAFQWWASSLSVEQTVTGVPSGAYDLSAVVASWEGRTVAFSGNGSVAVATGMGDQVGVPVAMSLNIGSKEKLTISAGSSTDWWTENVTHDENDPMCFFKIDDVQLRCNGFFLSAMAIPLPNDPATLLIPDQWYYYDVDYHTEYVLAGKLNGLVYTTDEDVFVNNITPAPAQRKQTLGVGRVFFKTTQDDATLQLLPARAASQGTFTAVALNVDGLPNTVATFDLNPDGPGADGTKKISRYLATKDYDLIGCSEDFNYNGSLMESLNDRYWCGTIRNTISVTGLDYWDLIQGKIHVETDGLNLIWKFSKINATEESWTRWWETESTDGNQYVEKGYRHYDVQIDGGPVIDVYILHMDAGDTNATWSRESQWRQLADAINGSDHSRAKLIIGDTNSRYTREDVTGNFTSRLADDFQVSDVWVELCREGIYPTTDMGDLIDHSDPLNFSNYEIVDKIIYINPTVANSARLLPQSFRIEQDYTYDYIDHNGNTQDLGDHRPVVVTFAYKQSGEEVNPAVTLADEGINRRTIESYSDVTADVTLSGRTLYKDGRWNTICLPFNVDIESSVLAGATAKALVDAFMTSSTLTLTFGDPVTTLAAGVPYVIRWTEGDDLVDPTFIGVSVTNSPSARTITKADGHVKFTGTYDAFTVSASDDIYCLTDQNVMEQAAAESTMKACRAYFQFSEEAQGCQLELIFFDDVVTNISDSSSAGKGTTSPYYTLEGLRIDGKPLRKGLYIRDGRICVK